MGNSPPSGKRQFSDGVYASSFGGPFSDGVYTHPKKRSISQFASGRSIDVDSSMEAIDDEMKDISAAFPRKTSIKDFFRKKERERSNSCTLVFAMDNEKNESKAMLVDNEKEEETLVPTVFSWKGGGNEISISGSFNNWERKIPLARNNSDACIILNIPPGEHEYKFFIDGAWYHDPTKPIKANEFNTKNNVVIVRPQDSNVITALDEDIANSKHQPQEDTSSFTNFFGHSPPGEYGQIVPPNPEFAGQNLDLPIPGCYSTSPAKIIKPPILPPLLAQGLLNKDTDPTCDPNLLPSPNHVIVNHLYALSIKNGVIVLSVIHRYRQKYVSTLFYKPIKG